VNFVAHVEVAHRLNPVGSPAPGPGLSPVLVGAALPDLAAIGGYRLAPRRSTGDLAEGIRVHHRTDDVFHADERFRELMGRLRSALAGAGFGRGAARACGHVGVELLLDGHLLADRDVAGRAGALLWSVGRPSEDVLDAVPPVERESWAAHLGLVAERIAPESYRAAHLVAARLHRILGRRPRLAFAPADTAILTGALRRIQPAVGEVAEDLVADSARAVR
jgi:hypothetical protein